MIARILRSGTARDWSVFALGLAVMGANLLWGGGPL